MTSITREDLVAMAKVAPELDELGETASEWWLGFFGVDKAEAYARVASTTWPRWRDGFSYNVTDTMRLRTEPFAAPDGRPAVGIILTVPEEGYEKYLGWVAGERLERAQQWVDKLNAELDRLRALWAAAGKPT